MSENSRTQSARIFVELIETNEIAEVIRICDDIGRQIREGDERKEGGKKREKA